MASDTTGSGRLAVLIDADNANPKVVEPLLAEVARYGVASVKRAYGDWTTPQLGGWKTVLLDHSIQPMQQFANTKGKNATDSAMIIDAMDLLHTRGLDGFCIVSSDSDFTGLARRIRENGLLVVGFGERKTPKPFVVACDRFVYTELLLPQKAKAAGKAAPEPNRELLTLIRTAIDTASDDSGWAALSAVGSAIAKQSPAFDSRSWGHAKLSGLVKSLPEHFQVEERSRGDGKALFIRDARSVA
ncbi:NYN domain-containing protein [Roseomonas sp. HJA6]|uniref:NYN domain-containing protein n=1 Tax=Roseomonas alba TaxID=2846776 RepID=A0ABS7AEJ0_9PROT|nr:NYN domain-containing protein [Neoroseomonas alba]MBW6400583.1 NYN domain-containing protein [Neoroseomonas alba]